MFQKNIRGSVTVFTAATLFSLTLIVFLSLNAGKYYTERKCTNDAADACALSLATWEARYLNGAALLNRGVTESLNYIRAILAMGVASMGPVLYGDFRPILGFARHGKKGIQTLWKTAVRYSNLNKKLKKLYPATIYMCARHLMNYYEIKGLVHPALPKTNKREKASLSLPLNESEPLRIMGSIRDAIARARSYRPRNPFKRKLYKIGMSIFERAIRSLYQLKGDVHLQVHLEEAPHLGIIHFLGFTGETSPFLDQVFHESYRTWSVSAATVSGGDVQKTTWFSRLTMPDEGKVTKLIGKWRKKDGYLSK